MSKKVSPKDQKFIQKCIDLSKKSVQKGDAPFASVIVKGGEIIAKSTNNASNKISDHAEILVLHRAAQKLGSPDLSGCTLYTNCEPCPMCAFMSREYKIRKVVFAIFSPYVGGYSKWPVLQDQELSQIKPFFGKVPQIIGGVLEQEALAVFDRKLFWVMGSDAREKI
jgi:tRNA(adenine34) deaminase